MVKQLQKCLVFEVVIFKLINVNKIKTIYMTTEYNLIKMTMP